MKGFVAILGLICMLQMGQGQQDEVIANLTIVQNSPLEVKSGSTVVLECLGSVENVLHYLTYRVYWTFHSVLDGTDTELTAGFYPSDLMKSQFGDGEKYEYHYGSEIPNYLFRLTIKVDDQDSGTYTCSQKKGQEVPVGNPKSIELLVIHAVKEVMLDLMASKSDVGFLSSKKEASADKTEKLSAGTYDVSCRAKGSYPCPTMALMLGSKLLKEFDPTLGKLDRTGDRMKCTGNFKVSGVKFQTGRQVLKCVAGIPGKQYNDQTASLNLQVVIDKPDVSCEEAKAAVNDRKVFIKCNVTSMDTTIECNKLYWKVGNEKPIHVYNGNDRKSKTSKYDIMQSSCVKITNGAHIELELYHIYRSHMDAAYFLVYITGADPFEHMLELKLRETSSACIISPMSLLLCLAIAVFSRLFSKHL